MKLLFKFDSQWLRLTTSLVGLVFLSCTSWDDDRLNVPIAKGAYVAVTYQNQPQLLEISEHGTIRNLSSELGLAITSVNAINGYLAYTAQAPNKLFVRKLADFSLVYEMNLPGRPAFVAVGEKSVCVAISDSIYRGVFLAELADANNTLYQVLPSELYCVRYGNGRFFLSGPNKLYIYSDATGSQMLDTEVQNTYVDLSPFAGNGLSMVRNNPTTNPVPYFLHVVDGNANTVSAGFSTPFVRFRSSDVLRQLYETEYVGSVLLSPTGVLSLQAGNLNYVPKLPLSNSNFSAVELNPFTSDLFLQRTDSLFLHNLRTGSTLFLLGNVQALHAITPIYYQQPN